MTIAEVLVVMFLFLAGLGLIAVLFSYVTRTNERQHTRIDAQAEVLHASRLISRAFSGSPRSGQLFYYQDEPAPRTDLVMAALTSREEGGNRGWDDQAYQPEYQGYWVFYRDPADETLKTHYTPIAPSIVIVPPTEAAVSGELSGPNSKVLAERVTAFQLRSMRDDSVQTEPTNPMHLSIEYRLKDDTPLASRFSVKCILP